MTIATKPIVPPTIPPIVLQEIPETDELPLVDDGCVIGIEEIPDPDDELLVPADD
jgi:hypothetical protein